MDKLLHTFYKAFQTLDAETMIACYHDEAIFQDPAFGKLTSFEVKNMWHMLVSSQKGKKFTVEYQIVHANRQEGRVNWQAKYNFSPTGRKVHNHIVARFTFKDDLIHTHHDQFNIHHWAAMALGWKGRLLGGFGFFKNGIQKKSLALLHKYMRSHPNVIS